jgi:hypothetical protein
MVGIGSIILGGRRLRSIQSKFYLHTRAHTHSLSMQERIAERGYDSISYYWGLQDLPRNIHQSEQEWAPVETDEGADVLRGVPKVGLL